MQSAFFEVLEQRQRGLIGGGVRWISPWVNDAGIRRQYVVARALAT